eukprot:scaffold279582_cov19-Tisochrysis_lutea.AAC.2
MDTLLALLCQCAVLAKCLKPVCITAGGCKGACLGAIRDNEYSVETTPGKILVMDARGNEHEWWCLRRKPDLCHCALSKCGLE